MPFTIKKQFAFSASHQLTHLPEGHKCHNLHGHNYIVEVELTAQKRDDLDCYGFVQDYNELDPIKQYIDKELDHKHLNSVFGSSSATTAEGLCYYLFKRFSEMFPRLTAVRVSETPKTWACFYV